MHYTYLQVLITHIKISFIHEIICHAKIIFIFKLPLYIQHTRHVVIY